MVLLLSHADGKCGGVDCSGSYDEHARGLESWAPKMASVSKLFLYDADGPLGSRRRWPISESDKDASNWSIELGFWSRSYLSWPHAFRCFSCWIALGEAEMQGFWDLCVSKFEDLECVGWWSLSASDDRPPLWEDGSIPLPVRPGTATAQGWEMLERDWGYDWHASVLRAEEVEDIWADLNWEVEGVGHNWYYRGELLPPMGICCEPDWWLVTGLPSSRWASVPMMKVGGARIEYVSTVWDDMVGGWSMPSLAGAIVAVNFS